eukprot:3655452-Alexandrium_andersonii.AAC.1
MESKMRELASWRSSRDSRRHSVNESSEAQVPSSACRSRDIPEASRSNEDSQYAELRRALALTQARLIANEEAAQAEERLRQNNKGYELSEGGAQA